MPSARASGSIPNVGFSIRRIDGPGCNPVRVLDLSSASDANEMHTALAAGSSARLALRTHAGVQAARVVDAGERAVVTVPARVSVPAKVPRVVDGAIRISAFGLPSTRRGVECIGLQSLLVFDGASTA